MPIPKSPISKKTTRKNKISPSTAARVPRDGAREKIFLTLLPKNYKTPGCREGNALPTAGGFYAHAAHFCRSRRNLCGLSETFANNPMIR